MELHATHANLSVATSQRRRKNERSNILVTRVNTLRSALRSSETVLQIAPRKHVYNTTFGVCLSRALGGSCDTKSTLVVREKESNEFPTRRDHNTLTNTLT